ncbi:MAG: hypothetical protein OEV74_17850, partial [Cyclobacteriaceae bacterium]|nr:hypothetical protein [Cyclobacteriaceae bacterium]
MHPSSKSLLSRTSILFYISLFLFWLITNTGFAQSPQPKMSDFVLYSGNGGAGTTTPANPGYAVQLGSSVNVTGGSIGSSILVQTTGNAAIRGNIFSKGAIVLANGSTVSGDIAASNTISVGSNALLGTNTTNRIDANGNIVVGGGTVYSKVTHPQGTSYTGPAPQGGNIVGPPTLPVYPALPSIKTFAAPGTGADITKTVKIAPGAYSNIKLSGNQSLTFDGAGVYVVNEIANKNSNTFVFDFKNNSTGTFVLH